LNEAESWVKTLQEDGDKSTLFRNASISTSTTSDDATNVRLASSNRYSLALAPQLIYTDSKLLDSLVSSKVYKQLEFQAMGSWFVYEKGEADTTGTLLKIPTTREDLVFSDKSIDIRSKRAVMKVLRFLVEFESQEETWRPYADKPFSHFLNKQFKLPDRLHGLFYALTLSLEGPEHTTTAFALPRIARHLRTTGIIGPGFNSVIHKYGGLSEIAQLACRAGAVGGAVYVLNKDLKDMGPVTHESGNVCPLSTTLSDGEKVQASWVVGTRDNIPVLLASNDTQPISSTSSTRRSVAIVSSPFLSLFPPLGEGAATPAGAVVVFPAGSLAGDSLPVYLIVHSSDTGDCPQGQSKSVPTSSILLLA
jgi:RAB protein geranylgeranyltransferase component A